MIVVIVLQFRSKMMLFMITKILLKELAIKFKLIYSQIKKAKKFKSQKNLF